MPLNILNADLEYAAGLALFNAGRLEEAEAAFRCILARHPEHALTINVLGLILRDHGQTVEAEAAFRRAIELMPGLPEAHTNLGLVLIDQDRLEEGIAAHRRAVELRGDFALAHYNLGCALRDNAQVDEAIAAYSKSLALVPGAADALANLALLHLTRGDYVKGFELYEARWQWKPAHRRHFEKPTWDGSPLDGKRLLVYAEQGFGDTLFCMRYAPMLAERGAQIVVECQRELVEVVRRVRGVEQVVCRGEELPEFDVHCAMLSLPWCCRTTLETIPPGRGYLSADAKKGATWRKRLADVSGIKVGLVWAGAAGHLEDRKRSMPLAALLPLAKIPGVSLYSLQKGPAGKQVEGTGMVDYTPELKDFDDTTALVANLDLVISVDTAVAHLAAGMGKPMWMLLALASDWRWLRGRDDSPWYPTVRLFRQKTLGNWPGVVTEVEGALAAFASSLGAGAIH